MGLLEGFVIYVLGLSDGYNFLSKLPTLEMMLFLAALPRELLCLQGHSTLASLWNTSDIYSGEKKSFVGAVVFQWRPQTITPRTFYLKEKKKSNIWKSNKPIIPSPHFSTFLSIEGLVEQQFPERDVPETSQSSVSPASPPVRSFALLEGRLKAAGGSRTIQMQLCMSGCVFPAWLASGTIGRAAHLLQMMLSKYLVIHLFC